MQLFDWLNKEVFIQIIGYAGMILVIASFFFKDVKTLRLVNIAGSALSMMYGLALDAMPTAVLNLILIILNTAMLVGNRIKRKMKKEKSKQDA